MRVLRSVQAEREQLRIALDDRPGVAVIKGAAGSGKTTTALLRLRQLCAVRRSRRRREQHEEPVRVLVLTYNRSLAGYVRTLAAEQVELGADLDLSVSTFGKWAEAHLNLNGLLCDTRSSKPLRHFVSHLPTTLNLDVDFLLKEIDYAFGRFQSSRIEEYLERDREGRGQLPRVDKRRLLQDILTPYRDNKSGFDWNDVAENMATLPNLLYDVIIVDEAQDFSANQVRGTRPRRTGCIDHLRLGHRTEDLPALLHLARSRSGRYSVRPKPDAEREPQEYPRDRGFRATAGGRITAG